MDAPTNTLQRGGKKGPKIGRHTFTSQGIVSRGSFWASAYMKQLHLCEQRMHAPYGAT